MSKKITSLLLGLMLVLTAGTLAADVTGKWSGEVEFKRPDGSAGGGSAFLDLKQTGQDVTGTAGPNEGEQHSIQKGRIEGNKLTMEVPAGDSGNVFKIVLTLVGDDKMEGDIEGQRDDGEKMTAKIKLARQK